MAATAPSVSSVVPASGSVVGGEQVTINGSGFLGSGNSCAGGYHVWFGSDVEHGYALDATSYTVLSDTQIRATVPPNFGGPVNVAVHDTCGNSSLNSGDVFTYTYPSTQCVSGTCSISVGGSSGAGLRHAALGFLDGFNSDAGVNITSAEAALVRALHPRQWRLGQTSLTAPWGGEFALAHSAGAQISLDLTSDWQNWAYNNDNAFYKTPYGDLSTYYSFIYNDVQQRVAAGMVPDYFDVWNEPVSGGTVNQWLSVYGTAYRAITAADPSAQVVGPSIAQFQTTSANQPDTAGYDLSLSDFLNWEMSTGYRFAAITWHEDGTTVDAAPGSGGSGMPTEPVPGGYRDYWSPAAIGNHVKTAKALLAQYPSLAGTKIFVNEYGPTYAANIPGWMVGDFSALETSGADQGMLTCPTGSGCNNLLDGLLGADGLPQMPYWVMSAYSGMSGTRLSTSTAASNVYTLATQPSGSQTIQALVGRADDCWGGTQCPQYHSVSASPVTLSLSVKIPWSVSTVNVTVQRLPDSASSDIGLNDVATAPITSTITGVAVKHGTATVNLSSVHDGDAVYLTVNAPAVALLASTATSKTATTSVKSSGGTSGGSGQTGYSASR